jgi:hypothetical protein
MWYAGIIQCARECWPGQEERTFTPVDAIAGDAGGGAERKSVAGLSICDAELPRAVWRTAMVVEALDERSVVVGRSRLDTFPSKLRRHLRHAQLFGPRSSTRIASPSSLCLPHSNVRRSRCPRSPPARTKSRPNAPNSPSSNDNVSSAPKTSAATGRASGVPPTYAFPERQSDETGRCGPLTDCPASTSLTAEISLHTIETGCRCPATVALAGAGGRSEHTRRKEPE